jgi:hypothetical protein
MKQRIQPLKLRVQIKRNIKARKVFAIVVSVLMLVDILVVHVMNM